MSRTKQVIVMRKDLNMRKGKMVAQGSHASLAVFINRGLMIRADGSETSSLAIPLTADMKEWIDNSFTKVCLSCNSEAELDELYVQAQLAGLPCSRIIDNGVTEFNGVKTKTCIAIGPAESEEIDKITGSLPLL